MTLLIELSLFPFIVCFKLKGFADNRKLSFNKHNLERHIYRGEGIQGLHAPPGSVKSMVSMCYAGLILHEKWKGEKGRKGEGKGNRKVKLIGE